MALAYLDWNNELSTHFFSEEKAGKEVLLYVNEDLIETIGEPHNSGVHQFVEAVKAGPPWVTRDTICQKALQTYEDWRSRGMEYPPYIAYLALFVLAGGREGDFASHAYYPRLWDLVGNTGETRTPASFDRMIDLWSDLETWSREDKHERFGRFVARIRGLMWKVGLPLSQTLISEDERKHLPQLICDVGLDPADLPSPEVVLRILRDEGSSLLERRTLRVLDGEDSDNRILRSALLDVVIDELESWDGSSPGSNSTSSDKWTRASLRLCLKLDKLSHRAVCSVRIHSAAIFPENGCVFYHSDTQKYWNCEECFGGWSNTLYDFSDGTIEAIDGAIFNWARLERIVDEENRWVATLRPTDVRVFTSGSSDGLPNYVERHRIERNSQFFIATDPNRANQVRQWGNESCKEFEEYGNARLPNGWILFSGKAPTVSCPGIDVLTISSYARLQLRGGVRASKGNVYLKVAPPYVRMENGTGRESVTLNGEMLPKSGGDESIWYIPDWAPVEQPLRIDAIAEEDHIQKIFRLTDYHLPPKHEYTQMKRDEYGNANEDNPPFVVGPIVTLPDEASVPPFAIPFALVPSAHIVLLGSVPGEIAPLSEDAMPLWRPIWSIIRVARKRSVVFFCGTEDMASDSYQLLKPIDDKTLVRRWKEAVWYRRKRTTQPYLRAHRKLWIDYVKAAENVK